VWVVFFFFLSLGAGPFFFGVVDKFGFA